MKRKFSAIILATLFSATILILGYVSFGLWVMLIFSSGFFTGLIIWLLMPANARWDEFKIPFWLTFILFFVHRVEEKVSGFFKILSEVTNIPTPNIISVEIILLLLFSIVGWLFIPFLVKRGSQFGYYLAWTFFASMGITELAHFLVFPFLVNKPFTYFPGMLSVVFLAPVAWWGMYKLTKSHSQ